MASQASSTGELLAAPALVIAPRLLGSVVSTRLDGQTVAVRLTEVEAYEGAQDPGSHGYRGRTARNAALFGPPGTLYVYFTYGMHFCANLVCGVDGMASAVLLRAGEVIAGRDVALARRGLQGVTDRRAGQQLASGPARLAQALGLTLEQNGVPVGLGEAGVSGAALDGSPLGGAATSGRSIVSLSGVAERAPKHLVGPRTGVSGPGGGPEFPWRFWLEGEPSVSRYRPAAPRRGASRSAADRTEGSAGRGTAR